jgi:hypothetical protein
MLLLLNTSLGVKIFGLPKEFCVNRAYWQRIDIVAIRKSAFV